ncbi:MAG: phosphohydrolase [Chloroflexi bacterium HGW-Chloroflexi-10]|nr:MAG: phosphohydrolase [Chloroflexi bacterium HGW-Chloroflexi-10]
MQIPTRIQAEAYLEEAAQMNPGLWVEHSRYAAKAAHAIAQRLPEMDAEAAYILALLHDIGRREGMFNLLHCLHGYQFMQTEGFPDAARVCVTHCFLSTMPNQRQLHWDGTANELEFLQEYMQSITQNDYDHLVLLCDSISTGNGYCLLEKRIVDVTLRYGLYENSLHDWRSYIKTHTDFESRLGCSVYALLPGVVENTFGFETGENDGRKCIQKLP